MMESIPSQDGIVVVFNYADVWDRVFALADSGNNEAQNWTETRDRVKALMQDAKSVLG